MHTDVIYDADLQMSWVNNCIKFIEAKPFILSFVFISYFLESKILRGMHSNNYTQYRVFYEGRMSLCT